MLISITECLEGGVWTGRPDLGLWCNNHQPALTSGISSVSRYLDIYISRYLVCVDNNSCVSRLGRW